MKTNSYRHRFGFFRTAAVALLAMLSLPVETQARPRGHYGRSYYSYPRSGFSLSFGTGYAGRGYYYGPPGTGYYYSRPGVFYYPNYYSVPRVYYGGGYYGRCSDVQRALYGLGYYRGPIDGIYGPGTRGAVLRYRSHHGLRVTAVIDRPLLATLGLW
jgi:hypothetical protein